MHSRVAQLFCVFFVLIISINISGQFQPVQVEKSSQKILLQGKIYFVHTVKQGQTLYSICKVYGVTQQEIAQANPTETIDVIKPGQVLRIPDKSALSVQPVTNTGNTDITFIYHTVQAKENAYFLSKKYNIPEQAIYKFNPGTENGLQIGQVIKIPSKYDAAIQTQVPGISDTSKVYIVKSGDTLYTIAQRYGVEVSDFIAQNPDLRWGLKPGMTLQIPGKTSFGASSASNELNKIVEFSIQKCDSIRKLSPHQPIKIALLMPFFANEIYSMDSSYFDSTKVAVTQKRIRALGISSYEFYQGVLLAVDSLKKANENVSLFTYDTRSDTNEVKKIIKELEIVRPNVIIGPIKNQNVTLVSEYSRQNKIPLILPLTKAASGTTKKNPYAVFLLPDNKSEIETYAEYIAKYNQSNIIVIYHSDTSKSSISNIFRKKLFSLNDSAQMVKSDLYHQVVIGDTLRKNLGHALRRNVENIVVVLSNNEASVVNIASLLSIQGEHIKIKLFGLPSWQHFKNLRTEQLHKLNSVLYSPFYIDYSKPVTKSFVLNSRQKFGSEPFKTLPNSSNINFTYLGYESCLIFGSEWLKYNDYVCNCISNIDNNLPQSQYVFRESANGGFINSAVNLIEYNNDYTVTCKTYVSTTNQDSMFKTIPVASGEENETLPIEF